MGAVLAAVHHAEVVAHRVGEPFGSLVLAVAVTVIEVALIVTLMAQRRRGHQHLARDTVFAAVMISLNGIVGLSLLVGAAQAPARQLQRRGHRLGARHGDHAGQHHDGAADVHDQRRRAASSRPRSSPSRRSPRCALYGLFVFTQTVRHRDFFLPVASDEHGRITGLMDQDADGEHADPPTTARRWLSLVLLLVALVAVVGLAKLRVAAHRGRGRAPLGFPRPCVGVVIALLVLLPETVAAVRNARRDRVQISLNLAYGSAMASIGLTIPTIAVAMIWLDGPLGPRPRAHPDGAAG